MSIAAAAVFLTTFSPDVAFRDAPESVAGVRTLGVLHPPGYPTYVGAAHLFGRLVPVGSWSLRVNLFSLICAALTVGTVFRIARIFGASRAGACIGAFALALTASFWFNAGFAKYYTFSALLLAGAALAALLWQERDSTAALVTSGLLLGLAFGAGWPLAAIMTLSVTALIALGPRLPSMDAIIGAVVALGISAAAGIAFLVVRANQDPVLNWGNPNSVGRLRAVLARDDFGESQSSAGDIAERLTTLLGGLVRDFGLVCAALAIVGCLWCWYRPQGRLDIGRAWFLVVAGVLNLLAVGFFSGITTMYGFYNVLVAGGYLLATMIVVAVLVAMGATGVIEFLLAQMRAHAKGDHNILRYAVVFTLAAAVVVPSLLVHRSHANLRSPVAADSYGQRVLDALPEDAVLVVWGEEFSMPMHYQQLVDHQRPDVTIVSANSLGLEWSRQQLTDRYGLGDALRRDSVEVMIKQMIDRFEELGRPVYFDTTAMRVLAPYEGYRTEGLVGKAVEGEVGAHAVRDAPAVGEALQRAERADGYNDPDQQGFANEVGYAIYGRAHIELAKAYARQEELPVAVEHLRRAVELNPDDTTVRDALEIIATTSDSEAQRLVSKL